MMSLRIPTHCRVHHQVVRKHRNPEASRPESRPTVGIRVVGLAHREVRKVAAELTGVGP